MPTPWTPRDWQVPMLEHLARTPRANLWAGMGSGKTVVVLTYLDWCYNDLGGEPGPTLVLGPLRVVQSVWPAEAAKWAHLGRLRVETVVGTKSEREAALARPAQVYCLNYDNLLWLRDHLDALGTPWPFRRVVADESSRVKSYRMTQGGKRAQVLGQVAFRAVEEWVNLTGTPAPNGLRDLWGPAWFLDKGRRLGISFGAFERRWFRADPMSKSEFAPLEPLPYAQEQIESALRDITLTVSPKTDAPIENVIKVPLPQAALAQYKTLEKDLYLRLTEDHEVEAFNAAALSMKCLQFANGALYADDGKTFTEVHDAKLEALRSVVEEAAGAPVLVAYNFKSDLARLQRAFPDGRVLDADPRTVERWNAGRTPLLFAHPASAGHGLNLQDGGNILVFFGLWWDLEQHAQIVERIGPLRQKQSGHDRPVFVHYLIAAKTIDEVVLARLRSKATVQRALLDAMQET